MLIPEPPTTEFLQAAIRRNVRRARNGFIVLLVFVLVSMTFLYRYQRALCRESHRRYDTLIAVIHTSTSVSPIARERLPKDQLAQLEDYYHDLRARLTADLGDPPTC